MSRGKQENDWRPWEVDACQAYVRRIVLKPSNKEHISYAQAARELWMGVIKDRTLTAITSQLRRLVKVRELQRVRNILNRRHRV